MQWPFIIFTTTVVHSTPLFLHSMSLLLVSYFYPLVCPKGHTYYIGDVSSHFYSMELSNSMKLFIPLQCGRPVVEQRCYCGSLIGGRAYQLRADNRAAHT